MADPDRIRRALGWVALALVAFVLVVTATGSTRHAFAGTDPVTPTVPGPVVPDPPIRPAPITPITPGTSGSSSSSSSSSDDGTGGAIDDSADASIDVNFPNVTEDSSNSVVIILLLTVLSIAPSLLVLCTSFTRVVIVLSLTRNAIGIPSIPPQQVIVGLSVFLTLFVMGPTLSEMKDVALDPLLAGEISTSQALEAAQPPLREFLLAHTREGELELFLDASDTKTPVARDEVPLNALIPAFVLSELKSGFIIGFVIFVPFLIIDLVVSAVLMGLGMMMLPPSFVSLPFKLLLFVMLDGWMLVVGTLLTSYH
ncbi:MAG: flagellar type III secretion system pore protein FliP [Ilumatobacteraceae bacterium]